MPPARRGNTAYRPRVAPPTNVIPQGGGEDDFNFGQDDPDQLEFGQEGFYEQEFGTDFGGFVWQEMLAQRLPAEIAAWAKQFDLDPNFYVGWFSGNFPNMLYWLDDRINRVWQSGMSADAMERQRQRGMLPAGPGQAALVEWANSPMGLETIYTWAWDWMGMRIPGLQPPGSDRNGRGGGGGRRGPTAAEIRAQFDMDELTNRANSIWQSLLLEDNENARRMAKAYVDLVVKNPDQRLDFDTYIEENAKKTGRWASIYKSLPDGMDPRQYMAPYLAMAMQFVAPQDAQQLAIGGAQFGADPASFRQLLGRQDAVTGSAPFIQELEGRMSRISGVLKG